MEVYFYDDLMCFVDQITIPDRVIGNSSKSSGKRKLKIIMICSLLSNLKDPHNTLLQTLIGLYSYANGLRDRGFKVLNEFGVSSSIYHIREHGNLWASARSAVTELNQNAFWRVTVDNLDFRMKFSRKVVTGITGAGDIRRMLNLITPQVPQFGPMTHCSIPMTELLETNFKIEYKDGEWKKYGRSSFVCTALDVKSSFSLVSNL